MNILYHHRTTGTGAPGHHIWGMVKGFETLGHIVKMVAPPGVAETYEDGIGSQKKGRYKVPQLLFEFFEIAYNVIAFFKIVSVLRRNKINFIYERYAIFNIAGVIASKIWKIPIIMEVSFTSKTDVYPKRSKMLNFLAVVIDKYIFRNVTGSVVVSKVLKDNILNNFTNDSDKILVLPNAVDEKKFDRMKGPGNIKKELCWENKKIIGFVGGFYPWHGIDMLIDAAKIIVEEVKNARFMLIGDGPIREELELKSEREGVKEFISFLCSVSHEKLPAHIAAFDVGIVANSTSYSSPMKMFEYMAMAKPVIAPKIPPIEEVIENGVNGFLFEQGNTADLAEAIKKILIDEEICIALGEKGYRDIVKKFTWTNSATLILKKWIE